MDSLAASLPALLRSLLASQPPGPARAVFAWKMAAGPALARACDAVWRDGGTLVVRAHTDAWSRELARARPLLLDRVRSLLGDDSVRRLVIESDVHRKRERNA